MFSSQAITSGDAQIKNSPKFAGLRKTFFTASPDLSHVCQEFDHAYRSIHAFFRPSPSQSEVAFCFGKIKAYGVGPAPQPGPLGKRLERSCRRAGPFKPEPSVARRENVQFVLSGA